MMPFSQNAGTPLVKTIFEAGMEASPSAITRRIASPSSADEEKK